ncbi:MAG: hypothetical protein V3W34_12525 [Phycisphaerae bacterium]
MSRSETTIDILNELLKYESESVLHRLVESNAFVSWASADERQVVGRMVEEQDRHRQWLVEAIHKLGGEPRPVWADIGSTHIHYLELSFVLPKALDDRKRLLAAYEEAASQVTANQVAGEVISKVLEHHRRHVEQLVGLTDRLQHAAS